MSDKTMPTGFRAGLVQLRAGREVAQNLADATALIREAAAGGADYVLTPEMTNLMEMDGARLFVNTRSEDGNPDLAHFRALARELKIWLHIGSMTILASPEKVANRAFLITPDGAIAARYDKIHMFDVELPNGESYRESKRFLAGNKAVLADLPWGALGMTICYDLRFPHLYRTLAKAGASFLAVPAAFTKTTGKAHWHILLRARAIETGCYVFAAAQGGHHENGRDTFGHSLIVSPWGEILAEADIHPAVIFADVKCDQVSEAHGRIPSLNHDRPMELARMPMPTPAPDPVEETG